MGVVFYFIRQTQSLLFRFQLHSFHALLKQLRWGEIDRMNLHESVFQLMVIEQGGYEM